MPLCKKVGKRRFNSGAALSVKIDAKDQLSAPLCVVGEPDVLDRALPLDIGKDSGLVAAGAAVATVLTLILKK